MKIKKVVLKILSALSIVIIVLAVIVLVFMLLSKSSDKQPNIFGYMAFRVVTGSMEPEYPVDTMVIVKEVNPEELQVGDVVSFYSSDPNIKGSVNTHRIVAIDTTGGTRAYTTKGDANTANDEFPLADSNIIGIVVGQSRVLGFIASMVSKPLIFFPIIFIPLLIVLTINIVDSVKLGKKLAKEEEKENLEKMVEALKKSKENIEKQNNNINIEADNAVQEKEQN